MAPLRVESKAQALWLRLVHRGRSCVFEFPAGESRAVVVGSHVHAELRVNGLHVPPVLFHFEREGDRVFLVPGYRVRLHVNAAPIARPVALAEQASVECSYICLAASLHLEPPTLSDALPPFDRDRRDAYGSAYVHELPADDDPTCVAVPIWERPFPKSDDLTLSSAPSAIELDRVAEPKSVDAPSPTRPLTAAAASTPTAASTLTASTPAAASTRFDISLPALPPAVELRAAASPLSAQLRARRRAHAARTSWLARLGMLTLRRPLLVAASALLGSFSLTIALKLAAEQLYPDVKLITASVQRAPFAAGASGATTSLLASAHSESRSEDRELAYAANELARGRWVEARAAFAMLARRSPECGAYAAVARAVGARIESDDTSAAGGERGSP